MKILHIADTHLGYSAYRKTNDEGINQREQDTYDAFHQFIEYAVQTKPDLILHSGDLFDSVRPTNRAITFALQQILRVSKQGIPFIVIDGNHEHPKLRETGHIFSIFDHLEHVYPVYQETYKTLPFTIRKEKVLIHAVPQCASKEHYEKEMKKIKLDSSAHYNILVTHGCVKGIQEFSMNEFNELFIPTASLKAHFDYIALGHYHKHTKVHDNAWYAGSPERFTFADAGEQKGFIEVECNGRLTPRFIPLQNRSMIDAEPIDCSNLTIMELMTQLKTTIKKIEPDRKIIRITLQNIPPHLNRGIDYQTIKKLCEHSIHYELKTNILKNEQEKPQGTSRIGALVNEFERFLDNESIKEKNTLRKLGIDYIEKTITKEAEP
ncbi:MAG: exonuclease SbcCD subunit D [Methanobacteriota archaeon]